MRLAVAASGRDVDLAVYSTFSMRVMMNSLLRVVWVKGLKNMLRDQA